MAKRAARPDEFRAFYRAHYGLILTVAEQRLDTVQAAEDAAGEVFQIAWRRYRDDGAALTLPWVYQILRNVIGTEYRRLARARRANERARDERHDEDPAIERRIDVREGIRRLAERDRELLYMAYWEDLTGAEMAEILGTSRGAVRVRLTRARERLRAVLSGVEARDGDARG
ncbi:MAG TPA: sigma-70 family RNA polymerase sigma factor [Candidatus Microbacterium stercoravium]|uniref:Sigma-70 family RNA polymerase sigma factor n=1 Tax=Candidatus Microbacterium stercoravium TaxID=2838697 RepID=A0A9D2KGM3_9MICO|nr:sigma-70 family RNA polymerase sigma factor [Candidatus Microbacterium stercoravium]